MSNLNKKNVNRKVRAKTTVNHEGETSFTLNAKESIVNIASTSLISDKFYESKDEGLKNLAESIAAMRHVDPEFVLKTAAYARNVLNMRSVPQAILVECANRDEFKPYVSKWAPLIMVRADEPADAMAYQINKFGRSSKGGQPIPACLRRAIKKKIEGFNEYQLAKYRSGNSVVKLADVIKLTHPKLGDLGKKIIEGDLKNKETWESKLSATKGEDKSVAWEEAIPTMGYMALLRNLRNFIKEDIDDIVFKGVLAKIADRDQVKKSKQFPFRFYSAYVELDKARYTLKNEAKINKAMDALAVAMDHAVNNVEIEGTNLFLVDSSGSMHQSISNKNSLMAIDVACLLGCIGVKRSDASRLWTFDTSVKARNPNRTMPILDMTKALRSGCHGGGTYFHLAMEKLIADGKKYDNIVVVSDFQCYERTDGWAMPRNTVTPQTLWKKYLGSFPDAKLHIIDSVGYNRGTPFKKDVDNVHIYSGWSEKILEMIGNSSSVGLVHEIEEWDPFVIEVEG